MKLRSALLSAAKKAAPWQHGNKGRHQDPTSSTGEGYAAPNKPHHKDSDGATTSTTIKSSSCGTTETDDEEYNRAAGRGVGISTSTTSSLIKLAKKVSRLGGPSSSSSSAPKDELRSTGGGGRSVSSNSLSTGCRTGPLRRGEPLRRQITGPFPLRHDNNDDDDGGGGAEEHSYIDDETHGDYEDDDVDEAGMRRIRGHPFEMTEEDKKVILSCLAHSQQRRGGLLRSMSSGSMSHHTPQYRVEICAKGLEDDDTLDGIMTEKLREEAREAEATRAASVKSPVVAAAASAAAGLLLFRARSGGSKSSSVGILASLRRSSGSVVSSLSGTNKVPSSVGRASCSRGHHHGGGDDADTLDEFMAREQFKEEDRRRRTLRRVGSGILETLDRLRRTHSTLLDRNDLWLKRSLEAIEMAKLVQLASKERDASRRGSSSHPRDIVVKRQGSSNTLDSLISSMLQNGTEKGLDEPSTPPLIEKIQDKVEALLPRCAETAEPPPVAQIPKFLHAAVGVNETYDDERVPVSPLPGDDDHASVALIEVFVHYLTCGHVLRDHELKQSPRLTFPAVATAFCAPDSPMMIPNLDESSSGRHEKKVGLQRRRAPQHARRRGLCSWADCGDDDGDEEYDYDEEDYDDDEDRTYRSEYDDGTIEESVWRRRTKEICPRALRPKFARSSTESTIEEKKEGK